MPVDPRLASFDKIIRQSMKTWSVPGVAVGILAGNRVIHAQGYGLRDVARRLPVTEGTRFGIGSCSKAFTAAALAMLVDEGKLDWDAPVRRYLPSFQLCDPVAGERTTPRDLLTHRTGLPGHNFTWVTSSATRLEMIERLRHLQPTADFRAKYQYNNLMYMVAGALVECLTGRSWEQFVAERIFQPLGMADTFCFHAGMRNADDLAIGYEEVGKRIRPWRRGIEDDASAYEGPVGPAGAICSNVLDMCKWLRLQMDEGRIGRRILISDRNLRQTHTPQIVCPGDFPRVVAGTDLLDASYGMGWTIQPYRGRRMLYHSGLVAGYNAVVSFLPSESLGIVVLTSILGSPVWPVAMLAAYDRLLGLKPINWLQRWKCYMDQRAADRRKQKRQQRVPRDPRPPRPLVDYAGTYHHPGYGPLHVFLENGRLAVRYNALRYKLKHHHGPIWDMVAVNELWKVTFDQNKAGRVDSLTIPFEPAAPCTFKRAGTRP